MTHDALSGNYEQQQAEAWKNRDMVEAHHLARKHGDKPMEDVLAGAAEITVQAHVNRCEVPDCRACNAARILGIERAS